LVLFSIVWNFFLYDVFSGLLHICLDNPNFIAFPIIGDSCLEFQWHHHIPTDITSKSFFEVCGDLNASVVYALAMIFSPYAFAIRTKTAVILAIGKLLMAYFGQFCHRMSHTPAPKRGVVVQFLQGVGIMIPAKEHGIHHQTYDSNFCIGSGIWNPFLSWVLKLNIFHDYVFLVAFLSMLLFDVPVMNYVLTKYAGQT
jgi:palmitoyl-[glycerolipid] 3-(E)-desaturase